MSTNVTVSRRRKLCAAVLATAIVLGVPLLGSAPAHARQRTTFAFIHTGDAVAANSSSVAIGQDADLDCDFRPGPRDADCDLTIEQHSNVEVVQVAEANSGGNSIGDELVAECPPGFELVIINDPRTGEPRPFCLPA